MKCSSVGHSICAMKNKPLIVVLLIQAVAAGRAFFAKASMSKGMNPYVFVAYRQAFATAVLAPFAFFLESNSSAPLSLNLLCKIFFVALCGMTMALNLDAYSLNYTSATFNVAISNTLPAVTFIIAVLLRVENISTNQWHGLAKVLGSIISLLGAMVFTFIKGPPMYPASHKEISVSSAESNSKGSMLKGALSCIACQIAWSLWIITQGTLAKEYPSKLRLTTLQTFLSCVQSAVWAVAMDRNISSWKLGWDVNLLSIAYCGVIFTGVTCWLRIWVIEKKGPVFLAMFTPVSLVIAAFLSAIMWKEALHWGSIGGALFLVGGLYGYLWGKEEEDKSNNNDQKSNTEELEGKSDKDEQNSSNIEAKRYENEQKLNTLEEGKASPTKLNEKHNIMIEEETTQDQVSTPKF